MIFNRDQWHKGTMTHLISSCKYKEYKNYVVSYTRNDKHTTKTFSVFSTPFSIYRIYE